MRSATGEDVHRTGTAGRTDIVGERGLRSRDRSAARPVVELFEDLDDLRRPRRAHRVALRLQPSGGVDGKLPVDRRCALDGRPRRLAGGKNPRSSRAITSAIVKQSWTSAKSIFPGVSFAIRKALSTGELRRRESGHSGPVVEVGDGAGPNARPDDERLLPGLGRASRAATTTAEAPSENGQQS